MGFIKLNVYLCRFHYYCCSCSLYPALGVSNSELPWEWVQLASTGKDVFVGVGAREIPIWVIISVLESGLPTTIIKSLPTWICFIFSIHRIAIRSTSG